MLEVDVLFMLDCSTASSMIFFYWLSKKPKDAFRIDDEDRPIIHIILNKLAKHAQSVI